MLAFESDGRANGVKMVDEIEAELGDPRLDDLIGAANHAKLAEDIELLDGAAEEFDLNAVQHGELSPRVLRLGADQFWRGAVFEGVPAPDPHPAAPQGQRDRRAGRPVQ